MMKKTLAESLFVGKNILTYSKLDSTNNYASQLLRQSVISEGDVVVALDQTEGRGQRGNTWITEPGKNLTFSIVFTPKFLSPKQQFYLNKAVSLAIVDLLNDVLAINTCVKWPNDIYVGNDKICGILIESGISEHFITSSVVGIGLNVNQSVFEGLNNTTSIKNLIGKEVELENLLKLLLINLERNYLKLKQNCKSFDREYLSHLKGYQEVNSFLVNKKRVEGFILGVNKIGQLEVAIENEKMVFNFKEIVFL